MLLRVSFENHRSFKEQGTLSLVPSALKESNRFVTRKGSYSGLPASVLYGANASGKSGVIEALRYIRNVVQHSHSRWEPDRGVLRMPFKLNEECQRRESSYMVDFVAGSILYQFGFSTDGNVFNKEWLYAYPKRHKQILYERSEQSFKFGKNFRGPSSIISKVTRSNSLFLSAAIQNNHPQTAEISKFFSGIKFASDIFNSNPGSSRIDFKNISEIVEFLSIADIGIGDARVETEEAPEEVQAVFRSIKKAIEGHNEIKSKKGLKIGWNDIEKIEKISFGHKSSTGEMVYIELGDESGGTIRLANLLSPIFKALQEGDLVIVDEIDASLHTLITMKILELFSSSESNSMGAQLVAATHDTNLLSHASLSRDQIWFTEKNSAGESVLYPMTDFSVRRTENLERGYLDGRYGGIPFIGNVTRIRQKIEGAAK